MSNAHITPVRTLFIVWGILVLGTTLTVLAASQDFGRLNTPVALGIAVFKATAVVLFFMGVRFNTPLTKVVVIAGFAWQLILFGLGMSDYLSRPWMGVLGR